MSWYSLVWGCLLGVWGMNWQAVKARRAPRDCFQSRLGTLACESDWRPSHDDKSLLLCGVPVDARCHINFFVDLCMFMYN